MTNEDNDKAQFMRDKARENAAFYFPELEAERAKVRELEAQLAHAQAACAPLRRWVGAIKHAIQHNQPIPWHGMIERAESALGDDGGKGWLSPDEAAKLQAQCAAMRKLLNGIADEVPLNEKLHEMVVAATDTTAGQELLDRLFKYEAQWNDMNFTICKLEQDLRKAKGEQ